MKAKIRILLVEDNSGDARLMDMYLQRTYGDFYSMAITPLLTHALTLVNEESFDVVILDLSLPDSSGLETFKRMYDHSPKTPIIVLTGLDDEILGVKAMQLGAQDFLIKAKTGERELSRSINYTLERYKLLKKLSNSKQKLEEKTQEIKREKARLADAQKIAHIGSWEWNISDNSINWSDELYRIYGMDPKKSKINLKEIYARILPADRKYIQQIFSRSQKTLKPFSCYYRILMPDDQIKTIQARGEVILNNGGVLIKMVGTDQDVTAFIREKEFEKLALAATQSFNSVIIADRKGKIEWVNEGFTKLTGYELDDVRNTQGEILRGGNPAGLSNKESSFEVLLREKTAVTYESQNFTKDGKAFWVITTLTPILGKTGEVERILAIDSDISERKRMEEDLLTANRIAEHSLKKGNKALNELIKAKGELEQSMKVKERFLANMSHEIRTPMNAIVGFTNLMLKTKLDREQKKFIEAVKISGENLLVIINDILDFSKIESGRLVFEKIELSLSQVIATVTQLLLQKSIEKNISMSTRIDPAICDHLIGDPTRLSQILLNLVGNAIKFTERGEVNVRVELVSETELDVELRFSVSDTGIGISEEKIATIFRGFTQASDETTRRYGGTGLGLTIAKQLVEKQGGSISIESEEEKGSTFRFQMKFLKNLNVETAKRAPKKKVADERVEGVNVLLVEDNILNQVLASKILSDWKWNVDLAENGLIAIEKVKKNNFDVILMDIQLPEMDGLEATKEIRKRFPYPKSSVPIIALTAHALTGEAENCIKAGMNDYVSKPIDTRLLYSKVIAALGVEYFDKRSVKKL